MSIVLLKKPPKWWGGVGSVAYRISLLGSPYSTKRHLGRILWRRGLTFRYLKGVVRLVVRDFSCTRSCAKSVTIRRACVIFPLLSLHNPAFTVGKQGFCCQRQQSSQDNLVYSWYQWIFWQSHSVVPFAYIPQPWTRKCQWKRCESCDLQGMNWIGFLTRATAGHSHEVNCLYGKCNAYILTLTPFNLARILSQWPSDNKGISLNIFFRLLISFKSWSISEGEICYLSPDNPYHPDNVKVIENLAPWWETGKEGVELLLKKGIELISMELLITFLLNTHKSRNLKTIPSWHTSNSRFYLIV